MMAALSLRTWRRNGVACDELLFWPGTSPVEHDTHNDEYEIEMHNNNNNNNSSQGGQSTTTTTSPINQQTSSEPSEADTAAGGAGGNYVVKKRRRINSSSEHNNSFSSIQDNELRQSNSIEEEEEGVIEEDGEGESEDDENEALLSGGNGEEGSANHSIEEGSGGNRHHQTIEDDEENVESNGLICTNRPNNLNGGDRGGHVVRQQIQRFGENHPRLTWLGTFFFFRNSINLLPTASYAPSGPSVFGASLDLSVPVLFNFHLFILAFNRMEDNEYSSDFTAKCLPIIFFSVLIVRVIIPPGRRLHFFGTLKYFFTTPIHKVQFRDVFIGEVITSWIRPGQDLLFALSYYLTVIFGTISRKYNLIESGDILEDSWLLHNVVLPTFALLPLFLMYLQTLRQAYDANKRWPYQANSIKYLSSTLVIIYGLTHPDRRTSPAWMISFVVVLMYQIVWDVVVDWELFEIRRSGDSNHPLMTVDGVELRRDMQLVDAEESDSWWSRLSSFRPNNGLLLKIQMYCLQPMLDFYQRQKASIPSWSRIQLRSKRLYKTDSYYWWILAFNCITRCAWMLCFIPAYHVSHSRTTVLTSTSDVDSYWGVMLPAAEIVRRALWGFLFLERETIKLMDSDSKYSTTNDPSKTIKQGENGDGDGYEEDDNGDDDAASKFAEKSFRAHLLPTWLDKQQQISHSAATVRVKQREFWMRQLWLVELGGWAAAFFILGVWAAITT